MSPLSANLNFVAPDKSLPGAFEFPFVTCISSGEPLHLITHNVPIHDLRLEPRRPSIDIEEFTWESVPFDDLDGSEGWEDRYAVAICEWLKKHIGARVCKPTNYQIRRRAIQSKVDTNYDTEPLKIQQPVPAVHLDINRERADARALEHLGDGYSSSDHLAIINIWRPLKGPVMDAPLAVCDARTLDPADMERTTDKFGGGYFIRHNENMKWFYIRDQMPDEILVFRQHDNTLVPQLGDAKLIAHTAFFDEERQGQGVPRESIEVRCAVVY